MKSFKLRAISEGCEGLRTEEGGCYHQFLFKIERGHSPAIYGQIFTLRDHVTG